MNKDDSAASSIAEEPLSLSILSSIAEEPLALSLSTDDKEFEGGVTRIPELEDGIFEPLFSSTPGKRRRVSYEDGCLDSSRTEEPLLPGSSVSIQEQETSCGEESGDDDGAKTLVDNQSEGEINERKTNDRAEGNSHTTTKRHANRKKCYAETLKAVKDAGCCTKKCLESMDLAEMCMIRKSVQGTCSLQKRQTLLDCLWVHAKPNESDLQHIPYYLSGYRVCSTAYRMIIGLSAKALSKTYRNFLDGIRTLQKSRSRNLTHKRLMAETWMEAFTKRVGDKMPDTGALHLPSYLDKTIMYRYMKADLEDGNEDVVHYSTFCHLLSDVFPHVKIPKVNRFTRCDYCTILGEEKRKARDRDVRKYLDKLFDFHNDLQMRERKLYYHHREKAKQYPHEYACIAQDGMDQAKLLLPRLIVTAHAYASARKLRTHLTGVLNHGRQPKGYFDLFQYPHDSNLTINILLLELQSMGEDLPDTLFLQMDNCWRENKNQFVLNFLGVLVMLDIFVKVKLNFLMVGHTHEAVDQMFNKLSECLVKQDTRTFSELMSALEKCYTPSPKAVEVENVFDVKEWMAPFSTTLHNISNPHAFKFTKAPSGKVVMQYKNWGSDKSENWKPDSPDPEQWLTILKEDVEINPSEIPDYVIPNTEKLELGKLRTDIEKFYKSRLFSEEHKTEWSTLLSAENAKWSQKERASSWPLQDILARKANLREKQKLPESGDNGLGFLGQKPEGVPVDVDDMVRNQVAPVREVYGGVYRRPQPDVLMVDSYEGVVPGSIVAVNLDGNYKPPHLAEVQQVDNTSFTVQWLKGGYKTKWVPWHGWTSTQIPKESVIYFDIDFDENGKLKKEAAQYLRRRYKELQKT